MNRNILSDPVPELEVVHPAAFSEVNSLLLPVSPESVDTSPIEQYAASHGFAPKSEYHFTIIGTRNVLEELHERLGQLSPSAQAALKTKMNGLITGLGAARLKPGQYHRLKKAYEHEPGAIHTKESIIQEADIDGIKDFYRKFTDITGVALGTPFPHVTLFTKGTGKDAHEGIGIVSAEFFGTLEHRPVMP